MIRLTCVLLMATFLVSASAANFKRTDSLNFTLDGEQWQSGNVFLHSRLFFDSEDPQVLEVAQYDLFDLLENHPQASYIISLGKLVVPKPSSEFSREKIFSGEGFAKISLNSWASNDQRISPRELTFDLRKSVSFFSVTSKVNYQYLDSQALTELPAISDLGVKLLEGETPYLMTIVNSRSFSRFFEGATNICAYSDDSAGEEEKTRISCVTIIAVKRSLQRTVGRFFNLTRKFEQEMKYTFRKILEE